MDQLLPEPAGQRLAHLIEQLGQLYVVVPVMLPKEGVRLPQDERERARGGESNIGSYSYKTILNRPIHHL